jgi:hypothetical protein
MRTLQRDQFERAKDFIFSEGRPLDQRLFDFHFGEAEIDSVISELIKFQNEDGGFGNALEPDLRTPLSSALATSVALRNMVEVGVSLGSPILEKTVSYLLGTLDRKNWRWIIAPDGRDDSPHAPWWGGDDIASSFRGCFANPSAEITGLLLNYKQLVPADVLYSLLERLRSYLIEAVETRDGFQMHDLVCYLALAHSNSLDEEYCSKISPLLIKAADSIVEKDKAKWSGYSARPLWLCDHPNSILYPVLEEHVNENLDFEIETQNEDGSWSPFWDWGGNYSDDWKTASKEWSSHLTLNNLIRLRNFDRLNA